MKETKFLILGMGNPILSDDGVGLSVARLLQDRIQGADVTWSPMVGLNLLDVMVGYETVFIIDAMTSPGGEKGRLAKIAECDRTGTLHLFSSHGLNIFNLFQFGTECGLKMPRLGGIYGIEIGNAVDFGEDLSPALEKLLPGITEEIIADVVSVTSGLSSVPFWGCAPQE
jgi:hydrogenase maturation protease